MSDRLLSVRWAICRGGRSSVALRPQSTYLPQFFKFFASAKVIPQNEISGLDYSQIKDLYKESAGYFCVGSATERRNASMSEANIMVIDGDEGSDGELTSLNAVHRTLRDQFKLNHLIHSSFSEGRWRLIIPLYTPVTVEQLEPCTKAFVEMLQNSGVSLKWVKENGIISQPWFFPVIAEGHEYICNWHLGGELFEPSDYVSFKNAPRKKFDKNFAIEQMLNAESLHPATRDLAMSMASQGIKPQHIQLILESALTTVVQKLNDQGNYKRAKDAEDRIKDIPRLITTAFNKLNPDIVLPDLPSNTNLATNLSWPPGMMGELAASMYSRSFYPIKEVAVVAAFGVVAGLAGRTYNVNYSGLNLYMTLLMRTGMGKDAIQKFITQVFNQLEGGISFLGAKNYTSGKALLDELRMNKSKVCVFTEAGFMYQSKSGAKEDLQRIVLDLFSKSGELDMSGAEAYSSLENSVRPLHSPSLTIINESTPDIFNKTMVARDATNTGERARMIAFNVNPDKPKHNREAGPFILEPNIKEAVKALYRRCAQNQQKDKPDVYHIEKPFEYDDILDEYVDRENAAWNKGKNLEGTCLSRVGEKLNRLMGCLAVIDDPYRPVISREMLDWCIELLEYELSTVYKFIGAESESDFHENVVAPLIVRILQNEIPKDLMGDAELHTKFKFTARTMLKLMMQTTAVRNYLGTMPDTKDVLRILEHFINLGCLLEPSRYGNKHKVYTITPQFVQMFPQNLEK